MWDDTKGPENCLKYINRNIFRRNSWHISFLNVKLNFQRKFSSICFELVYDTCTGFQATPFNFDFIIKNIFSPYKGYVIYFVYIKLSFTRNGV